MQITITCKSEITFSLVNEILNLTLFNRIKHQES
uniref:Uncharacterized protein n=1 Tax=Arundo donax TaxID=35708 RepID=A0A0A9FV84_ARUDO